MEELKRRAAALDVDVQQLTGSVDRLGDRMDRSDRDRRWLVGILIVISVLTALLGWTVLQNRVTNQRLEVLVQQVVCPILGRSIGNYDPSTRAPEDVQRYEDSQREVVGAYKILECRSPIPGPPRAS